MSNLERNVYNQIANKYDTSLKTLKSNIAKATDNMNNERNFRIGKNNLYKLTPKCVICYIVEKIKME